MTDGVTSIPFGRHEFETVLDAVSEGLFTVDCDFTITAFNRAAEHVTGFDRASVIGRRCYDVFRTPSCGQACPMAQALRHGDSARLGPLMIHDQGGNLCPVHVRARPLRDHAGNIVGGVQVIVRSPSITDAKEREVDVTLEPSPQLPLLHAIERRTIEEVLKRNGWNRSTASQELGISRTTLWRKMRKLGIQLRAGGGAT